MIDIFNKIRRFSNNMQFEEGKPFEIVLAGEEDKNSSYKKEKWKSENLIELQLRNI